LGGVWDPTQGAECANHMRAACAGRGVHPAEHPNYTGHDARPIRARRGQMKASNRGKNAQNPLLLLTVWPELRPPSLQLDGDCSG